MNLLNSKIYRSLEVISSFFLLNLCWLVASLPVFTIFPASAAMFAVVREWVQGREASVSVAFFTFFKRSFRMSLWISVVWTLLGGLLAVNFGLIGEMSSGLQSFLYVWFLFTGIVYLCVSVYLLPVLVNYDTTWGNVIKNAFLLCFSQPLTTIQCVLIIGFAIFVFSVLPMTLAVSGSVTAYAVYRLCDRAFQRVADARKRNG